MNKVVNIQIELEYHVYLLEFLSNFYFSGFFFGFAVVSVVSSGCLRMNCQCVCVFMHSFVRTCVYRYGIFRASFQCQSLN